jgi:hypothetical protein
MLSAIKDDLTAAQVIVERLGTLCDIEGCIGSQTALDQALDLCRALSYALTTASDLKAHIKAQPRAKGGKA